MKYIWNILIALLILSVVGIICALLINRHIKNFSHNKIRQTIKEVPEENPSRIAIVYGAAVHSNGRLSDVLYDRVFTAAELYKAGKVKKILMSGDNSTKHYDEPTAMKKQAVELGVAEEDLVLDFAGRRTYDTCHRAKEIFEIKKAIHVTQEFHLPRAIYLCEKMGIESIGISSNRRRYLDENVWSKREFLARLSAWFEINFLPFKPVGGKKEPIVH